MDPLAHTLVGATLAETGLGRRTPLGTATLVLGANAPDIDILASFAGRDAALYFRRGITHGAVSMLLLPVALTGLVLLFDRTVRLRRDSTAEPARALPVFALALLSTISHPFLDWLNTYGVRLLMPFDDRWFYGDAIFIVDPWLWLLMAAAVVLARSRSKLSLAAWIVLGCAASALVLGIGLVPFGAKVVWIAAVSTIVALRLSSVGPERARTVARASLGALTLYVGLMIAGSRIARAEVRSWLGERGIFPHEVAAGPLPANPFARDVIARTDERYYFVRRSWLSSPGFDFTAPPVAIGGRDAVARAALEAPSVRGLRSWLRFPATDVERANDGYVVRIRDVRYGRRGGGNLGTAVVRLDGALRPVESATAETAP